MSVFLCIVLGLALLPQVGEADEIVFDARRDWQAWSLPGTVELTPTGLLRPVEIRRDINASLDAGRFGGGIRFAGSNPAAAAQIMDGDLGTGWSPDTQDGPDDWTIELDLGRGVSAERVRLLFDRGGAAPELFDLSLSTGEHPIDEVDNPIETEVIYRVRQRFKENKSHELTYELDQSFHTPIRLVRLDFLRLEPGVRLLEVEVEAASDNIALGTLERGGALEIVLDPLVTGEVIPLGNTAVLIDGDLFTRWQVRRTIQAERDVFSHIILDLGATYFVDAVKIVGGVVARPGGGITAGSGATIDFFVTRRSFGFNFYEVLGSDGSLAPDGSLIWRKHYTGIASQRVRTVTGAATHRFGPLPTRYIKVLWNSWEASSRRAFRGSAEELQVFGGGFPQSLTFESHIIDLGATKSLEAVNWQARVPAGARLEVRSRSGNAVDNQLTYYDKNGREVTERQYGKLIPSFKGPIDTMQVIGDDWSPYSRIYAFPGQEFQSPSPRRYVQLQVRMVTEDPALAAELDRIGVAFSEPISQRAVNEIFPVRAEPGAESEFSLFLRPGTTRAGGFDRMTLEAPTPVRFMQVDRNGTPVSATHERTEKGFKLTFEAPLGDRDLVEVRFAARIFRQSTPFALFIEDTRAGGGARQRVEPGDATDRVESSTNVVGLPVLRDLLLNPRLSGRVLTPNGDGANDEIEVRVDVVNILDARPLRLRLYDLAGRRVAQRRADVRAGAQRLTWDGRADDGGLVAPGLYLLELHVEGDAGQQRLRRLVSVVY